MNRPIFILGAHKSGSSLLRSLLDDHPALFVVPFEAHFFQMAHFWVDYRLRKTLPPVSSYPKIKEAYTELVRLYDSVTDRMSDSDLVGKFDLPLFEKEMLTPGDETFPDLIDQYIRAVYLSLFQTKMPTGLRVVEKSVENAEFAIDLERMFPDASFLHVVRNPYSNIVALRRHVGRSGYPFLGRILLSLNNSHYNLYRNLRLIDRYHVIRYEDLLQDPETTMRTVTEFLEIQFTDTLLQPTSVGQRWAGNSSRGIAFSGISAANVDLWRTEITHLEIYYVTRYFEFFLNEFGYEVLTAQKGHMLPVKGEDMKTYLLNRSISRFL